jgi:hypothetical protein
MGLEVDGCARLLGSAPRSIISRNCDVLVKPYYRIRCEDCGSPQSNLENPTLLIITDDSIRELFLRMTHPFCAKCSGILHIVYGPNPKTLGRIFKYTRRRFTFNLRFQRGQISTLTVKSCGIKEMAAWMHSSNYTIDHLTEMTFHPTTGVAGANTFAEPAMGHSVETVPLLVFALLIKECQGKI